MDRNAHFVGLELGGTKCVALLEGPDGPVARETLATATAAETLPALSDLVERWRAAHGIAAIGIASFGPVILDRAAPGYGRMANAPKPGWADADIVGHFRVAHGLPIAIDTDVNAAALAERALGAARGVDDLAYVTIGTGIGVGVISGGAPVHGLLHPELGHLRVPRRNGDGFAGLCPFHGDCIEGIAAGPAIVARTGLRADQLPADHPALPALIDELAGLFAAIVLAVSPRRIVVGGGVGLAFAASGVLARIGEATLDSLGGYVAPLADRAIASYLVPAALGADAGPRGAVLVGRACATG